MKRNFPSFLKAYVEFAEDGFCPPQFHLWTGLSIIAGALERKVRIDQHLDHDTLMHYPNIYVMLVSHPAVGKTTAMTRGVDFLERLRAEEDRGFKIIPNQATEPALVELMKVRQKFQFNDYEVFQSCGFFYAEEASSSALQNTCGDFIATLTAFYDCPKVFRKGIKMDKDTTEIYNTCFNLLAGSTFNYLKTLVNEETALGGFASRCIYVLAKDRKVRTPKWRTARADYQGNKRMSELLFEDLKAIHKLVGVFQPTPGLIERWEAWQPEFDKYIIRLQSPRLEAIYARKPVNILKVCMLLSASERSDLVLTEDHWEQALALIEEASKDNPFVISSAIISNTESQSSINHLILQTLKHHGGCMDVMNLRGVVMQNGNDVTKFAPTLKFLGDAGKVKLVTKEGGGNIVTLVGDPDASL